MDVPIGGQACDWSAPVETPEGLSLRAGTEAYRRSFEDLEKNLRWVLKPFDHVYTHNPWGEYGHELHVQVYKAVASAAGSADVWFPNHVSRRSEGLMRRHLFGPYGEEVVLRTDEGLGSEIRDIYADEGCWTADLDNQWPETERFNKLVPGGATSVAFRELAWIGWARFEQEEQSMSKVISREAIEQRKKQAHAPGPARYFTEQFFLPQMAAHQPVLSVGICWATERYRELSGAQEFYDVDLEPERHGQRPDIVADVTTDKFVELCPVQFGFVLAHGVVGHEIQGEGVRKALLSFHRVTRPGARLVCSWSRKRTTWPEMAKALAGLWQPIPVLGAVPYYAWRDHRDMMTIEAVRIEVGDQ